MLPVAHLGAPRAPADLPLRIRPCSPWSVPFLRTIHGCRTHGLTAASLGLGATPGARKAPTRAGARWPGLPCGAGGGMAGTVSKRSADSSLQIILPRILDSDNTLTRTGCKTLERALKLRQWEPQGRGQRHSASTSLSTVSAQRSPRQAWPTWRGRQVSPMDSQPSAARSREASRHCEKPPALNSVPPRVRASSLSREGSQEASAGERCSGTHRRECRRVRAGSTGRAPPGRQRALPFKRAHRGP